MCKTGSITQRENVAGFSVIEVTGHGKNKRFRERKPSLKEPHPCVVQTGASVKKKKATRNGGDVWPGSRLDTGN